MRFLLIRFLIKVCLSLKPGPYVGEYLRDTDKACKWEYQWRTFFK
mgnify:CR=1 FL=1